MGDRIGVQLPLREIYLSLTNHPGQLSLAIPPWGGALSTGQRAVILCDWGVKADMVLFAGNTVWSISEHIRGICVDALYKSTFTILTYLLYTLQYFLYICDILKMTLFFGLSHYLLRWALPWFWLLFTCYFFTCQVIDCEDHLTNDLYCIQWGVKLYYTLCICRPKGSDCGIVNVNIPTSGAEIGGAFGMAVDF